MYHNWGNYPVNAFVGNMCDLFSMINLQAKHI